MVSQHILQAQNDDKISAGPVDLEDDWIAPIATVLSRTAIERMTTFRSPQTYG
jgi:hypothetical protein